MSDFWIRYIGAREITSTYCLCTQSFSTEFEYSRRVIINHIVVLLTCFMKQLLKRLLAPIQPLTWPHTKHIKPTNCNFVITLITCRTCLVFYLYNKILYNVYASSGGTGYCVVNEWTTYKDTYVPALVPNVRYKK